MIDKIGAARPTSAAARAKKIKRSSASDETAFSSALSDVLAAEETAHSTPLQATQPLANMSALLGAQEVNEAETQRRRAINQGKFTLDILEKLRDALLSGHIPTNTLKQLENMVRQERLQSNDPRLNEVLDDIELRAMVEIAKLEMSGIL